MNWFYYGMNFMKGETDVNLDGDQLFDFSCKYNTFHKWFEFTGSLG